MKCILFKNEKLNCSGRKQEGGQATDMELRTSLESSGIRWLKQITPRERETLILFHLLIWS